MPISSNLGLLHVHNVPLDYEECKKKKSYNPKSVRCYFHCPSLVRLC